MVFYILEHLSDAFPRAQPVHKVDQIEVGKLAVEALDLQVEVSYGRVCNLQVDRSLDGTSPSRQVTMILLI